MIGVKAPTFTGTGGYIFLALRHFGFRSTGVGIAIILLILK